MYGYVWRSGQHSGVQMMQSQLQLPQPKKSAHWSLRMCVARPQLGSPPKISTTQRPEKLSSTFCWMKSAFWQTSLPCSCSAWSMKLRISVSWPSVRPVPWVFSTGALPSALFLRAARWLMRSRRGVASMEKVATSSVSTSTMVNPLIDYKRHSYVLVLICDGASLLGEEGGDARAGLVGGPVAAVHVLVAHCLARGPVFDAERQGVLAASGDAERGARVGSGSAVDVVGAGGRPESVGRLLADVLEDCAGVGVVLLDVDQLCRLAVGQRPTGLAADAQNVGQRPRVVGRLNGEQWHLDERVDVLGEEALPLFVLVGSHTLLGGRVDLLVGQLHEVLEARAVVVEVGGEVGRVQEDAGVGKRPDLGALRRAFCDVVGPQESGKSSGRLPCDCDFGGDGEHLGGLVDGVELGLRDVVAAEVEVLALVGDRVLLVALVTGAVAVLEVRDGPILEVVLGHVAEDARCYAHGGRVGGGAAESSLASLVAGIKCLGDASAIPAPPAALKAEQELGGLLALSDVVGALGAVQAQRVVVSHHYLLEGVRSEEEGGEAAEDDCSLQTESHYLQDTQKQGEGQQGGRCDWIILFIC